MALEDLTGNKYINSLNSDWPAGTDLPGAGDDHIRGIKNVLKRTFPNVTGPVTRTQTDINTGTVPFGAVLTFFNVSAPTGWERVTWVANTYMMRVVAAATAGQGVGGSHDPILNNKVPSHVHNVPQTTSAAEVQDHTHYVSLNTGDQSDNHTHTGWTEVGGGHNHTAYGNWTAGQNGAAAGFGWGLAVANTGWGGDHNHHFVSDGISNNHHHYVGGSSGGRSNQHSHVIWARNTDANPSASNWTPRYIDVIMCQKK